ncbi:MAG: tRNA glutamyl-Q(34) synthetase GluQRS [Cellvibrionaceae bacterium]
MATHSSNTQTSSLISNNCSNISSYIGRFAPSPTGDLHFGSLVGALASFLDARSNNGKWLVRIEDLDPPREILGSADSILKSLESHRLLWDDSVLFQSSRLDAYEQTLNFLSDHQLTFNCSCSRKSLSASDGIYDGQCRHKKHNSDTPTAARLKVYDLPEAFKSVSSLISFDDIFMGGQSEDISTTAGDYIIHRKDGLFAYQLAVVVDDIFQNITHVIRGSDLLGSTAQQIFLFSLLGQKKLQYGHYPVVLDRSGEKLSKKNQAAPLDKKNPSKNIFRALVFLQQNPPEELVNETPATILTWAKSQWNRKAIPKKRGYKNNFS